MKRALRGGPSPQQVIIDKAKQFGNSGIKKQQGTTRIIYDSLALDGSQEYRFFEDTNTRAYPLTNLDGNGQLGVGEVMTVERAYFSIWDYAPGTTDINSVRDLALGTDPVFAKGELDLQITESRVIKKLPMLSFFPEFNKNGASATYNNFEFDTQLVIQPLLNFSVRVRSQGVTTADTYLQMTIEGVGSLLSPKHPM